MIKYSLVFMLSLLPFVQINAQSRTYHATINRYQSDSFYIVSGVRDSLLITRGHSSDFISDFGYRIIWGEGRKKDKRKIREKNKKYLLSEIGDTLVTIYNNYELNFNDGAFIKRSTTDGGWQFINENKEVVIAIDLLWNDEKWVVDIENRLEGEKGRILDYFVLTGIVNWARWRTEVTSYDSGSDDGLWLILWLTSLSG